MPTQREGGGPNPPFQETFLQRLVGVSWGGAPSGPGRFSFVTGNSDGVTTWSMSALSDNGVDWYALNDFIQMPMGGSGKLDVALVCSIMRAGPSVSRRETILAMGMHSYPIPSLRDTFYRLAAPMVLRAVPGEAWTDAGLPFFDAIANDPDVTTWSGEGRWIGYNPDDDKFYVMVIYTENLGTETRYRAITYSYVGDASPGAWTQEDVRVTSGEVFTLTFPAGTMVSSQYDADGDPEIVWCNSAGHHQVINTNGHQINVASSSSILVDGNVVDVPADMTNLFSVAALNETICIGGFDADNNSIVRVSTDLGATWGPIPALQAMYAAHGGVGKALTPVFTCSLLT
jgi:hypothetical protein